MNKLLACVILLFSITPAYATNGPAGTSLLGIYTTDNVAGFAVNGYCNNLGVCGTPYIVIGSTTPPTGSPLSLVGLGTAAPIGTSAAGSLCIDSANNVYRKASCP